MGGPHSRSGRNGEEKQKHHCPCQESNTGRQVHSPVSMLTELFRLLSKDDLYFSFILWKICNISSPWITEVLEVFYTFQEILYWFPFVKPSVGTPEWERPLRKHRRRWEDNNKLGLEDGKGKFVPVLNEVPRHEDVPGEWRYSSTHNLTWH
jgi:hypothetical protein